jgi:hypothetical protein
LPRRRSSLHPRRLTIAVALAALVVTSGCIHYTPRPLPPEQVVAIFSDRKLDDPRLRAALDATRPARVGEWPRRSWDRADLLVAMLYFNDAISEGRATLRVATAGRRTARERPNPTIAFLAEYANEGNQLTQYARQNGGAPL